MTALVPTPSKIATAVLSEHVKRLQREMKVLKQKVHQQKKCIKV